MQKNKKVVVVQHEGKDNIISLYVQKGDGSNFDFIEKNKYVNIKKVDRTYDYEELKNVDNFEPGTKYHCIEFTYDSSIENFEGLAIKIEEMMQNKANDKKYEDILKTVIEYFDTVTSEKNVQKLRGDIGEALFILKCLNLNIIDKIKSAIKNKDDNDNLDFTFNNNQTIEVKTTTKMRSSINLGINQAKIESKNCNIAVIKINSFEKTKINENYFNLLDLYQKIDSFVYNNSFLSEKRTKYENNNKLVKNNYININEVTMEFLIKDYIPIITNIKNDKALLDIKFTLDASLSVENKDYFDDTLISIANKQQVN